MRKILVTGGTGFLGSAFLKLVETGDDVLFVITRQPQQNSSSKIQYIQADLGDWDSLQKKAPLLQDVTILIDLAARIPSSNENNSFQTFLDINFNHHVRLLELCPQLKKIIYASTIDVYGFQDNLPLTEQHPTFPSTNYGATKLFLEHYYRLYSNEKKIALTILRFTQIYGPYEPIIKVIPIFINKIRQNQPLKIVGAGEDLRGYIYLDDAAASILTALNSNKTGIYNVAGNEHTSLNQLVNILEEVTQKELSVERVAGNPPKHYYMDNSKMVKELGFTPKYDLKNGLQAIYQFENLKI